MLLFDAACFNTTAPSWPEEFARVNAKECGG